MAARLGSDFRRDARRRWRRHEGQLRLSANIDRWLAVRAIEDLGRGRDARRLALAGNDDRDQRIERAPRVERGNGFDVIGRRLSERGLNVEIAESGRRNLGLARAARSGALAAAAFFLF